MASIPDTHQPRIMHARILAIAVVPAMILCAGFFAVDESALLAIGDYLVIQDELQPADVIHVLSGPDHRADYAIQLYQQGLADRLFFTGAWYPAIRECRAERNQARAIERGVPDTAIVVDTFRVTSTYSEAIQLRDWLAQNEMLGASLIIVSDPFHMRRAYWTYRHLLGDQASLRMAPVPFDQCPYNRRWWTDRGSRQMVVREYLKIVYYYARYSLTLGPVNEWLASFDQD